MLTQAQIRAAWAPKCKGPFLRVTLHGGGKVLVKPTLGDGVMALDACLRHWNYGTDASQTGAYNCRKNTSGNDDSTHAYAIALDLNWRRNPYGKRLVTDMPPTMVEAICRIKTMNGKQVWNWGGYWTGNKDAMHFECVCRPVDLATGIDPRTVPGSSSQPPPIQLPSSPIRVVQGEDGMSYLRTPKSMGGNDEIYVFSEHSWERLTPTQWSLRSAEGAVATNVHPLVALHRMQSRRMVGEEYLRTPKSMGGGGEIFSFTQDHWRHLSPSQWKARREESPGVEKLVRDVFPLVVVHRKASRSQAK